MSAKTSLLRIAALLAPKSVAIKNQVTLACDDPGVYVAKFAVRLAERGVTRPRPDLGRLALLDALAEKRLLAEVDVHASPEDVRWALERLTSLPKRNARWKDLEARADFDNLTAEEVLGAVQGTLSKLDVHLVALDIGSDAFPLVVTNDPTTLAKAARAAAFVRMLSFPPPAPRARAVPDRVVHDERMANIEATLAVPRPEWRIFLKDFSANCAVWGIKVAELAIDLSDSTLGKEDSRDQVLVFASWEQTRGAAAELVAKHLADGYREVPLEEYRRRDAGG